MLMGGLLTPCKNHNGPRTNWCQVLAAFAALGIGALVYVLDRDTTEVPFFSDISLGHLLPSIFGPIGDSLPGFAHVFALSLLTIALFGWGKRVALWACLSWFAVDVAFEAGQHPQIATYVPGIIPGWFERIPILQQVEACFLWGTFDTWDLLSIAVGAAAAYLVAIYMAPRRMKHEQQN